VDPLLTAVNSIHPVDEPPLASGIDWVFELVHVSLGLLLLDCILLAFVWFSASHLSRATVYLNWKVFRGFLFGFPAGQVSWSCLPGIWMVFRWLFTGYLDGISLAVLFCLLVYCRLDILMWISLPYRYIVSLPYQSYPIVMGQWFVHHYQWPVRLIRWK
jgi:hypothetical protein